MQITDILDSIENDRHRIQELNQSLQDLAVYKAEKEYSYKVELHKKLLFYRGQGHGINLCIDLAKGDEKVAKLKLQSDIAESNYYIELENLKGVRQDIEVLRSLLSSEKFISKEV